MSSKTYTILGARWFTNHNGCVGIVAIQMLPTGQWKACIGNAMDTNQDGAQWIAARGNALAPEEAHGFFPRLDIDKYKSY